MKITIITSSDQVALARLNPTQKRRRKFKKDMSPQAVMQRRKDAAYRKRNKSKLKLASKRYYQRNKAALKKRREFLVRAPKQPVLQRTQAASKADWKMQVQNIANANGLSVVEDDRYATLTVMGKESKSDEGVVQLWISSKDGNKWTVGVDDVEEGDPLGEISNVPFSRLVNMVKSQAADFGIKDSKFIKTAGEIVAILHKK